MAKYALISDLHLGQNGDDKKGQYSLLSAPTRSCPAEQANHMKEMTDRLAAKIEKFAAGDKNLTLIVAGDLLDLSLAYLGDALADLGALLQRLPSVTDLILVVGNHDHHLWTIHSEQRISLAELAKGRFPKPRTSLYTPTDPEGERSILFEGALLQSTGHPIKVHLAYPSFRRTLHDAEQLGVAHDVLLYVTHGHLFGGLHTAMSQILRERLQGFAPERVAATVNFSIIEFIDWLLGETGEGLGADGLIETIYTDLQKGESSVAEKLVSSAVDALLPDGIITGIPDSWERGAVKRLGTYLLKRACAELKPGSSRDRHQHTSGTQQQLANWVTKTAGLPAHQRVIVAYGHTHVSDLHAVYSTDITAYNLGSWLVEPGITKPDTQVLLIDEGAQKMATEWTQI